MHPLGEKGSLRVPWHLHARVHFWELLGTPRSYNFFFSMSMNVRVFSSIHGQG